MSACVAAADGIMEFIADVDDHGVPGVNAGVANVFRMELDRLRPVECVDESSFK
jgi:hypothetical protein